MAKAKAKKQVKGKSPKKHFLWFGWLAIALSIAAVVVFVRISPVSGPAGSSQSSEPKAAIIDQLYSLQPNEVFVSEITQQLEGCGFVVDLYQGDEITVDFYRQLSSCGYKLIIFRAHSGLLGSEREIIKRTCLFTNELYSETKHIAEQLTDQLARARIDEHHPWVFGIGDEFVTKSMEGQFDNTVIIMMGCSCLYLDDLAQAFIAKGASAYLAWNATVDLSYVDKATVYLMKQLCGRKRTIRKAVENTMNAVGPDPKYNARLKYYPAQSGHKTLKELIQPVAGNS